MMKLAASMIMAIGAFIAHAVVTDESSTTTSTTSVMTQSDLRIFDPRPYLIAPTTTEPMVMAQSTSSGTMRCPEWVDLASSVGIKADEMKMAMRILYRESRCNPKSVNSTLNRNGTTDIGLAQLNDATWCLPSRFAPNGWLQQAGIISTCNDLLNAETNLRAMVAIMRYAERVSGCAWHPWNLCDDE